MVSLCPVCPVGYNTSGFGGEVVGVVVWTQVMGVVVWTLGPFNCPKLKSYYESYPLPFFI